MSWTTDFNTAKDQMIHDFGNGNSVIHDRKLNMVYKLHNGEAKEGFSDDGISLNEFEEILICFAKSFPHENNKH